VTRENKFYELRGTVESTLVQAKYWLPTRVAPTIEFQITNGVKKASLVEVERETLSQATHTSLFGGYLALPMGSHQGRTQYKKEAVQLWLGAVLNGGGLTFGFSERYVREKPMLYYNTWYEFDTSDGSGLSDSVCEFIYEFLTKHLNGYLKRYQVLLLRNGKGLHFHCSIRMTRVERLTLRQTLLGEFEKACPQAKWDKPSDLRPMGCWKRSDAKTSWHVRTDVDEETGKEEEMFAAPSCYLPWWFGDNMGTADDLAMQNVRELFAHGQCGLTKTHKTKEGKDMLVHTYPSLEQFGKWESEKVKALVLMFRLSSVRESWDARGQTLLKTPEADDAVVAKKIPVNCIYHAKYPTRCTTDGKAIAKLVEAFLTEEFDRKEVKKWPYGAYIITERDDGKGYYLDFPSKTKYDCLGYGGPHPNRSGLRFAIVRPGFGAGISDTKWALKQLCYDTVGKCAELYRKTLRVWEKDEWVQAEKCEEKLQEEVLEEAVQQVAAEEDVKEIAAPKEKKEKEKKVQLKETDAEETEEEDEYESAAEEGTIERGKDGKLTKSQKERLRVCRKKATIMVKDAVDLLRNKVVILDYSLAVRNGIYRVFKTFGGLKGIPFFEDVLDVPDDRRAEIMEAYDRARAFSREEYQGRSLANPFHKIMAKFHPAWCLSHKIPDEELLPLIDKLVPVDELRRLKIMSGEGALFFFEPAYSLWRLEKTQKPAFGAFWSVIRPWLLSKKVYFKTKPGRDKWNRLVGNLSFGQRLWSVYTSAFQERDAKTFYLRMGNDPWQVPLRNKKIFNCMTGQLRERNINDMFRFELEFDFHVPDRHALLWKQIIDGKAPETKQEREELLMKMKLMFPDAMDLLMSPFQDLDTVYDLLRALASCFSRMNMRFCYFIYGATKSGKSTIKNAIKWIFGDYFQIAKSNVFQVADHVDPAAHQVHMVSWDGKMAVFIDEIESRMPLSMEAFKSYVNQAAVVMVRAPYGRELIPLQINFPFFFIFNSIDVPRFNVCADEVTERMCIFEVNRSHFKLSDRKGRLPAGFDIKNPQEYNRKPAEERMENGVEMVYTTPEAQRIQSGWSTTLRPEEGRLSQFGTLLLLMANIVCKETNNGHDSMIWTESTIAARERFVFRNDTVAKFLMAFYEERKGGTIPFRQVYDTFKKWAEETHCSVMKLESFQQALQHKKLLDKGMVAVTLKKSDPRSDVWESSDVKSVGSYKRKEPIEEKKDTRRYVIPKEVPIKKGQMIGCPGCFQKIDELLFGLMCHQCEYRWPINVLKAANKKKLKTK